jgi:hypothetical protein
MAGLCPIEITTQSARTGRVQRQLLPHSARVE